MQHEKYINTTKMCDLNIYFFNSGGCALLIVIKYDVCTNKCNKSQCITGTKIPEVEQCPIK